MQLWERLRLAWNSELGGVLLLLVVGIAVLTAVYLLLMLRQRRRDRLAAQYHDYFTSLQALKPKLRWESAGQAEFFGRHLAFEGGFALMPQPGLFNDDAREHFIHYGRAVATLQHALFAGQSFPSDADYVMQLELNPPTQTLFELIRDATLKPTEAEELLLNIARGLAALHTVRGPQGEQFFHGWLLPQNIRVARDGAGVITAVRALSGGWVYALGAEAVQQRIAEMESGQLSCERFYAQQLLDTLPFLAPEQRDAARIREAGPATDFYSFGLMALGLLSGKLITDLKNVDWDSLPLRWQRFLRSCVESNPKARPRDFLELEDWLYDPELGLTQRHVGTVAEIGSDTVAEALDRVQVRSQQSEAPTTQLAAFLAKGQRAIEASRWTLAEEAFERALQIDASQPDVHVGLAICAYERGDLQGSEHHYRKAKAADPLAARRFREHLTYKV